MTLLLDREHLSQYFFQGLALAREAIAIHIYIYLSNVDAYHRLLRVDVIEKFVQIELI